MMRVDVDPGMLRWARRGAEVVLVAGQTVHYGCEQGGSILGETDRSQPLWVVSYLPEGSFESTLVAVETAWS